MYTTPNSATFIGKSKIGLSFIPPQTVLLLKNMKFLYYAPLFIRYITPNSSITVGKILKSIYYVYVVYLVQPQIVLSLLAKVEFC